ncbi:radical SAM/SPASM domain-containing protein [uncultured Desulfosarcina sp.]|uniref:radical SAM/SPASM domain-containing protein n=1 Tax=uncultured Desulfosarcina sp. TaxID=218289 RepID=UPI0029C981EA|nr:radical SAM protein [uncultured Desulfosarcina sp.]
MSETISAIDSYPRLTQGAYLLVYDDHGFVKSKLNDISFRVSPKTIELLKVCGGQHSIKKIIEMAVDTTVAEDDANLLLAILEINQLIRNRVLVLETKKGIYEVPLISSQGVYYPEAMHVELTTLCNLHCHFCYRSAGRNNIETRLPTSQLLDILSCLSKKGLRVVELTGGEPLLHSDLNKILDFCGNTFQQISILTNGTLINQDLVNSALPIKDKIAFNISLESHRVEEHDKRTGVHGSFSRTLDGIRQLSKYNFLVRVAMAVDGNNWEDVEPTLLLARQLGAKAFTYSAILPFGRASGRLEFLDLDASLVVEKEKYLLNKYKDFFHILNESQQQRMKQPGGCGAGHRTYAMDPAGNIRPCVTFDDQLGVIGSLANQTPEAVFSNETTEFFSKIKTPNQKTCGSCKFLYFCQNCVLRALTASRTLAPNECNWLKQPSVQKLVELIYPGEKEGKEIKGRPLKGVSTEKTPHHGNCKAPFSGAH